MAYTVIHTKQNGARYLYSVEGYWDKEKKAARNKQVCLGRIDETTGEVIPSERKARVADRAVKVPGITASSRVIGPSILLDKVAHDTGLDKMLKRCFPETHAYLMGLAYYLVQKGNALYRSEMWSSTHLHPFNGTMPSQRTSDLLNSMREGERQHFFAQWMKTVSKDDCFCYDLTSVSSYSECNEYVRQGYNRDGENLPQINLAMLFGQASGLPTYYRKLPGNIPDVATLRTTVTALDFIGAEKLTFVLDRGFYSSGNVDSLLEAHYNFILAVPTSRAWVEKIIDAHRDEIMHPKNYHAFDAGESLFMTSHLHEWNGKRLYLHIFFNHAKAAQDYDAVTSQLLQWKTEMETGNERPENADAYNRFFTSKQTPKRGRKVLFNEPAIEAYRKKTAGFFCILTRRKMQPDNVLEIYRNKEKVENCFDDLKNQLDMKRMRIHSSASMDSRLFVQFLSLILLSKIRMIAKANRDLKHLTIREMMDALETIAEIQYSGRYGKLITEAGPLQRKIFQAFGLIPDPLLHSAGK